MPTARNWKASPCDPNAACAPCGHWPLPIIRLVGEAHGRGVRGRAGPARRRVAIKAIKVGLATPEMLRRFEHETQPGAAATSRDRADLRGRDRRHRVRAAAVLRHGVHCGRSLGRYARSAA